MEWPSRSLYDLKDSNNQHRFRCFFASCKITQVFCKRAGLCSVPETFKGVPTHINILNLRIISAKAVGNHLRYANSLLDFACVVKTSAEDSLTLRFGAIHGLLAQC